MRNRTGKSSSSTSSKTAATSVAFIEARSGLSTEPRRSSNKRTISSFSAMRRTIFSGISPIISTVSSTETPSITSCSSSSRRLEMILLCSGASKRISVSARKSESSARHRGCRYFSGRASRTFANSSAPSRRAQSAAPSKSSLSRSSFKFFSSIFLFLLHKGVKERRINGYPATALRRILLLKATNKGGAPQKRLVRVYRRLYFDRPR